MARRVTIALSTTSIHTDDNKDYTWQPINISQNVQKEPWYTVLGPNGRIPVIVDHDQGGFPVQEGLGTVEIQRTGCSRLSSSQPFLPTSHVTTTQSTSSLSQILST